MGGDSDDDRPDEAQEDARVKAAWRSWLSALATDAEAAMAAALAYESLPSEGRDAWLDVLETDAPGLAIPAMALYAPLLAVESDRDRRERIESAIASDPDSGALPTRCPRALRGVSADGTHACVIVAPLYLDFVQILRCRYTPAGGFLAVSHDPLRHLGDLDFLGEVEGVTVEPTPMRVVVEELAHAIVADKREHRTTPAALASFAHLFAPTFDDGDDGEDAERKRP
jgi:hypothetical protein